VATSIWQANGGLYLGYPAQSLEGEPPKLEKPLRYTGDRHYCLFGANGSGKSMRLLIPNLHDLTDYSIVVNDVKGELCAMTAAHRRAKGSEIIILNPFNVLGLGSSGFNPIAALELNDDFPDDALELAEAVIRLQSKEAHWDQAAQEIVAALIMYTRLILPNGSFADVRALLGQNDAGIQSLVLGGGNTDPKLYEQFRKDPESIPPDYSPPFRYQGNLYPGIIAAARIHKWPEMEIKAARFGDINPQNRELHGVLSTALTQTRWLDSRRIKADLAKSTFDFSTLKDKPVTVFQILPARRLITHSPWLRLMTTSIVQKLMKDTRRPKVPVLLMLDEYYSMAEGDGFPVISRNMAMFRGYGIKLATIWQDLSQAKRIYGNEGFESFLANAGVVQVFAPQDVTTAEYVSKRSGQTTRQFVSHNQSRQPNPAMPGGTSLSFGANENYIPMPLLLAQDARNFDDGFSVIFSHREKGVVRSFSPWPGDLRHLKAIMANNPSA
jgi:type IV secretion system protein VirD4